MTLSPAKGEGKGEHSMFIAAVNSFHQPLLLATHKGEISRLITYSIFFIHLTWDTRKSDYSDLSSNHYFHQVRRVLSRAPSCRQPTVIERDIDQVKASASHSFKRRRNHG